MSTNAAAGSFEAVKETMGVSLAKTESAPFGEHIRDASTVGKIVTAKASDFNKATTAFNERRATGSLSISWKQQISTGFNKHLNLVRDQVL